MCVYAAFSRMGEINFRKVHIIPRERELYIFLRIVKELIESSLFLSLYAKSIFIFCFSLSQLDHRWLFFFPRIPKGEKKKFIYICNFDFKFLTIKKLCFSFFSCGGIFYNFSSKLVSLRNLSLLLLLL